MERVQLKLLLCFLFVINTTTGQYNNVGSWNLNYGGQPYLGQPNVMNWANYPGYGSYSGFVSQPAITPQYGSAFLPPLVAPQAVQQTNAQQTIVEATTSVPSSISNLQQKLTPVTSVAVDGNRNFTGDCYNIIDETYPMFSAYCSVLPQTTFSLPNFFGHTTKEAADDLLTAFRPALRSGCFSHMRMFLCPLFFPSCTDEPVVPCASLCRAVLSRCGSVDLSAIDCNKLPEKSEFCSTITVAHFLTGDLSNRQRIESSSTHGKKINYSNDYSETSSSASSSSFDSSYNQAAKAQANSAGYKGEAGSATGSFLINVTPTEVSKVTPSTPRATNVNSGATISQIRNAQETSAGSSSSNILVPSGSYLNGNNDYEDNASSSNNNKHASASSSSISDGSINFGDSTSRSDGSSINTVGLVGTSSYYINNNNNNNNNYGDRSSNENNANSMGSTALAGQSSTANSGSSYINDVKNNEGSAFLNLVQIHDSGFSMNNNNNNADISEVYDDEEYSNNIYGTTDSTSSFSNNENRVSGSTSYGNKIQSIGSTSYGNNNNAGSSNENRGSGSTYGYNNNAGSSNENRGSGSTSYGNTIQSIGSTSYGNNNNAGSSNENRGSGSTSYGNNNNGASNLASSSGSSINNAGLASRGSSSSYGGSLYSNGASYSGSGSVIQTGPPFGLQTTSEFINYVPEKLDLSKCGPKPTKNPCTITGSQHYEIPGYPHCYIHCSLGQMFVKPCPPELVWNSLIGVCDWPTTVDYLADENNNVVSSSYSTSSSSYRNQPSFSNGRKKRSTTERKKPLKSALFPSLILLQAPISPPSSSFVPLPGFSGAIGIPGPLVPQPNSQPLFQPVPQMFPQSFPTMFPMDTARFLPQVAANVAPKPAPLLPSLTAPSTLTAQPQMLTPIFPQPQLPPKPKPPQSLLLQPASPQPSILQPTSPQLHFPQPQVFTVPVQRSFEIPQVQLPVVTAPSSQALSPFIPPTIPTLPVPLDGPLLPPLPMTIPATYIPGPPPIFGAPLFGPFGQASTLSSGSLDTSAAAATSAVANNPLFTSLLRSNMGFGGRLAAESNFYGGFPQTLQGYNPDFWNIGHRTRSRGDNSKDEDATDDSENSASNFARHYSANYRQKRQYEPNENDDTSMSLANGQQGLLESPCIGKAVKSNIPHPIDSTKYIACLNDNKYEIMDCPSGFIYNADIDQCEKPKSFESICEREQPCLNDGQCYATSSRTYKCVCQGLWAGERCEIALSPCATNPCGEGNQCHALVTSDYQQGYVCICNKQQSYGLTCAQNTVSSPCIGGSNDQAQYYPFALSVHAYIQCDGDSLHVRSCTAGLFWNQETKTCSHVVPLPMRSFDNSAAPNQINYNSQPSTIIFDQSLDNFVDENTDEHQLYPYQYYNPYMEFNDENLRSNQMYKPNKRPTIYAHFSAPSESKPGSRTKNQEDFDSQRNLLRLLQSSDYRLEK